MNIGDDGYFYVCGIKTINNESNIKYNNNILCYIKNGGGRHRDC